MHTVGVIGLGAIAAGYGDPSQKTPYCHVGGIRFSDKVKLSGVADVSVAAQEKFRQTWGGVFSDVRYHESADALLQAGPPDIVAVCVRGPHHHEVTKRVIDAGPKAIFLEKPPTCSLAEMDDLRSAAAAKDIPITVSYSRHWAPHVLRMQQLVAEGLIGQVKRVVGYCGGTFLSFASHTTDLICQFAGYDAKAVYARGAQGTDPRGEPPVGSGYEREPVLEAMVIEFDSGAVGVQLDAPGPRGPFTVDVYGTEGRLNVGMYAQPLVFDKEGKPIDADRLELPPPASVFTVAYDQIADHLSGRPRPHCTDAQWHVVNEIGFAAIESALTNRRVELPGASRTRKVFANG